MSSGDVKNLFVDESSNKLKVPVDHLDYKYITNCQDVKELSRILRVLRSGEEGYYPDLIRHCEEKIQDLDPKSRSLRKEKPILRHGDLKEEEKHNVKKDLENFISENQINGINDKSELPKNDSLPPIRSSKSLKGKVQSNTTVLNGNGKGDSKGSQRLKSWDYKSWDKFDVESECAKVDEEVKDDSTPKAYNKMPEINLNLDTANMSDIEKETRAVQEKNKGNEAFKSDDIDEAIAYYTRSISLYPMAAAVNNRALAYLKQKEWKKAREDCTTVLKMPGENENIKAYLRRATANKQLKNFKSAKNDLHFVLKKEPNNAKAESLLEEVKGAMEQKDEESSSDEEVVKKENNIEPPKAGRKMQIVEVDSDDEKEEENEVKTDAKKLDRKSNEIEANHVVANKSDTMPKVNDPIKTEASSNEKEIKLNKETGNIKENTENKITPKGKVPNNPVNKSSNNMEKKVFNQSPNLPIVPLPPAIEHLKKAGGASFKIGQYGDACEKYSEAIKSLEEFCKGNKDHEKNYLHARSVLHNNRAACWLKDGNDQECVKDCNIVLEIKPWEYKALTRRACAYEHMEKYEKAYVDFKTALSMNWNDSFLQQHSNSVAQHLREKHGPNWKEKIQKVPIYYANTNYAPQLSLQNQTKETPSKPESQSKSEDKNPIQNNAAQNKATNNVNKKTENNVDLSTSKLKTPSNGQSVTKKQTDKPVKQEKPKPKKLSEEDKTEQKKQQIRRNLFEKLKADGNNHVRDKKYDDAIECYTKCMTMCPKESASYTNRALCFLKLNKPVSAVNDCTKAIELDPVNVKAYYRRALARKSEKFYKEAQRDLNKLLQIEPGNNLAKQELKAINKLLETSTTVQPSKQNLHKPIIKKNGDSKKSQPKKKILIEEVSSSDSDDEDDNLTKPVKIDKTDVNSNFEPPNNEVKIKNNSPVNRKENDKSSKSDNLIRLPFEFGNLWNNIQNKKDISKYQNLIDRIIPSELPNLLSNKTDDHVITVISYICQNYIKSGPNGKKRALELMSNLTKADRFTMAGMFMSKEDQQNVKNTIQLFKEKETVDMLLELYKDIL